MGKIGSLVGGIAGGAIGGPVGASIGSGLGGMVGGGGSSSGGGGAPQQAPLLGFSGGGVTANLRTPEGGQPFFQTSTTAERKSLIDSLKQNLMSSASATRGFIPQFQGAFGEAISGTRDLLGQVTPGASGLREARLTALENAKEKSKSNLTQNIARRRLGGSSFANQLAAEQDLAFAQEAEAIEAESFLQELELTNQLQQQLLTQEVSGIDTELQNFLSALQFEGAATQTELDEQNRLAELAAQMASRATSASTSFAAEQMRLAAQGAAGAGSFFGGIGQEIGSSGLFSGGNPFDSQGSASRLFEFGNAGAQGPVQGFGGFGG